MTSFVYAIECGGRIKIGHSTNPKYRFSKIASDSPFPCTFLGQWIGTREDEAAVHEKFADIRCYREWFAATDELRSFLALTRLVVIPSPRWEIQADDKPITKWRKSRRMTQGQVASLVGVQTSTVCNWEKGARAIGVRRVLGVSKATGIPIEELCPDLFVRAA